MAGVRYDKLLVVHGGALRRKYGAAGLAKVRTALAALVAADQERGLLSHVVDLDNPSSMRAVRSARVPDGDWAKALKAVDAACGRYAPAYVALVGATDVVPQAQVTNPLAGSDDDAYVPSDLPFACDLPDDWPGTARLDPSALLTVTQVVGRIPDVVGASDPAVLLEALSVATTYVARTAAKYQAVFALSAAVWKGSTTTSVGLLPGPAPTTHLSPPDHTGWSVSQLSGLTHFVNCHGGDFTPDWYGQASAGAPVDTVALRPEDVASRIKPGTVVATECCYGAMHQDPSTQDGRLPMLWAYLSSGAYAGVGSSTTAYGPADGNGQADLVCRFVLEGIMTGSSTGRALLDARQRYLREIGAMGPEDLKTIAQFDLLGDPSLVPVTTPGRTVAPAKGLPQPGLAQRRAVLRAAGRSLGGSVPRASSTPSRRAGVAPEVLAAEAGLPRSATVGPVRSYGERQRAPRGGYRFHVAPVQVRERVGLLVARESGGERRTTTIWRR